MGPISGTNQVHSPFPRNGHGTVDVCLDTGDYRFGDKGRDGGGACGRDGIGYGDRVRAGDGAHVGLAREMRKRMKTNVKMGLGKEVRLGTGKGRMRFGIEM